MFFEEMLPSRARPQNPGPALSTALKKTAVPPHLSDNGFVPFNSLQLFFTAHDVRSGQRQRLPIPTENRLALAHISRGQGEGSSWVHRVMLDMTKDSSTSKFLPSSSKFPGVQRDGVKPQTQTPRCVSFASSTEDCSTGQAEEETGAWGLSQTLPPKHALLSYREEERRTNTCTERCLLTTGPGVTRLQAPGADDVQGDGWCPPVPACPRHTGKGSSKLPLPSLNPLCSQERGIEGTT